MYSLSEDIIEFITVTDVKNYFFCKREVYINHIMDIREPKTESMSFSNISHVYFDLRKLPKSIRPKKILMSVRLSSVLHRLAGVLDALIITEYGEFIPAEIKLGHPINEEAPSWDRMQLAAYALLIEDNYNKVVKRGVLYYIEHGTFEVVRITHGMKELVRNAIRDIHRMLVEEKIPSYRRRGYCRGCWYSWICGEV